MLLEQVARRLFNVEEMQYSRASDAQPYQASNQSRFNAPELFVVPGFINFEHNMCVFVCCN